MKVSTLNRVAFILITLVIFNTNVYAQVEDKTEETVTEKPEVLIEDEEEEVMTVSQDPKFEELLNEKIKINSSITINDRYKIQIHNGNSESSMKTLVEFRNEYKHFDGTIVFSTPVYKVWVGSFKSRIEAERNLIEFKNTYPSAILIKPNN